MQLTTSALATVNSVMALGKTAVELAKKTKDPELKEKVSEVLNGILDLKGTIISLDEENQNLKVKLAQRGTITRDPRYGYWLKENETEPLCPKCYEGESRVAYLSPLRSGVRKCNVCQTPYYESGSNAAAISIGYPSTARRARAYWE